MIVAGDIAIAKYSNGECYLVEIERFVANGKQVAVKHLDTKGWGLYYTHEIVELSPSNINKIPEYFRETLTEFLYRRKPELLHELLDSHVSV